MRNCEDFVPSLDLAKKYWELYEKQISEDEVITREEMIKGVEFMGEYIQVTEEDMQKNEQRILGNYLMGAIVSYTQTKSEQTKGNCEGLVVKLTENNSFNKEFLNSYHNYFGRVSPPTSEFYGALHQEFLEYAKNNPEKFHYAKMRVTENNEIEFYDFKYEEFPDFDELTKGRWKVTE